MGEEGYTLSYIPSRGENPVAEDMTKRERLEAIARGAPTDRPAWSLWRHFYDEESSAEGLAEAMAAWERTYDFDFLKINPRAQYYVEPWGAIFQYPGGGQRPVLVDVPVKESFDWMRIERRLPTTGAFGQQLEAIRLIREALGPEVPIIQTVFTPLSVVADLVESEERFLRDLRSVPELMVYALDTVTETLAGYAAACIDAGADGIFLATTEWARHDKLDDAEYARYGRPYDLRVLQSVRDAAFNILHVCGDQPMLFELADYPVHAFSWAATSAAAPSLAEAAPRLPGVLVAGLSRDALSGPTPEPALAEAAEAYRVTEGRRWVLGANCALITDARDANLRALKQAMNAGL